MSSQGSEREEVKLCQCACEHDQVRKWSETATERETERRERRDSGEGSERGERRETYRVGKAELGLQLDNGVSHRLEAVEDEEEQHGETSQEGIAVRERAGELSGGDEIW